MTEVTVSAWASAPFSYRMASLTPDVTAPLEDAVTLGPTGYPEPAALEWEWSGAEAGWDSGLQVTPFVIGAQTYVRLTVARSDPDTNPGLVLLFTSERLLS